MRPDRLDRLVDACRREQLLRLGWIVVPVLGRLQFFGPAKPPGLVDDGEVLVVLAAPLRDGVADLLAINRHAERLPYPLVIERWLIDPHHDRVARSRIDHLVRIRPACSIWSACS